MNVKQFQQVYRALIRMPSLVATLSIIVRTLMSAEDDLKAVVSRLQTITATLGTDVTNIVTALKAAQAAGDDAGIEAQVALLSQVGDNLQAASTALEAGSTPAAPPAVTQTPPASAAAPPVGGDATGAGTGDTSGTGSGTGTGGAGVQDGTTIGL